MVLVLLEARKRLPKLTATGNLRNSKYMYNVISPDVHAKKLSFWLLPNLSGYMLKNNDHLNAYFHH